MGSERTRFLEQILETCAHVAELVRRALDEGRLPLVLGGDHSIALGTLGGLAAERGPGGVLWIDAHGDLNVPATTPTGNVHGMVLAAALGLAGSDFERDEWPMPSADRTRVAIVGSTFPTWANRHIITSKYELEVSPLRWEEGTKTGSET